MGGDGSYSIGPGFWGFVAFFVMAIALWLLVRNMSGRLRRMAYQERDREGSISKPGKGRPEVRTDRLSAPESPATQRTEGSPDAARPDAARGDQPGDTPSGEADHTP